MSCIYGPHQFGTEDQGWVAHFLIRAMRRQPITIYGDGMQVRDILFASDLVDAFLLAQQHMPTISGNAFNIGGGPDNTISLVELLAMIRELHAAPAQTEQGAWRPGDQRYYVSDTARFRACTGWSPKIGVHEGIERLNRWLTESAVVQPRPASTRTPGLEPSREKARATAAARHVTPAKEAS
jgi:CDP-paratose 2-epimerase